MISVIIPTFNEVKNIIPLIESLISILDHLKYEIIVVDDDSPDGTSDVINNFMDNNDNVKLITRIDRSGLSSAIKEGLIFARGDYLLVLDGDGQHDPACIKNILNEILEDQTDLVIASRFLESSQLKGLSGRRILGSKIANNAARISLNNNYINLTDYLSGCFCIRKKSAKNLIKKIEINGFKFLFELLSVSKGRLLAKEVPLLFKERLYGNSKLDIAALTVGEALAGGLIATAGRTAFTSAGRAALKDTLTKTTRKIGNLKNNRRLEPEALLPGTVDEGAQAALGVNAFEELWFKTLRNKGIDNLTPEEKVVMDVSRKYLR